MSFTGSPCNRVKRTLLLSYLSLERRLKKNNITLLTFKYILYFLSFLYAHIWLLFSFYGYLSQCDSRSFSDKDSAIYFIYFHTGHMRELILLFFYILLKSVDLFQLLWRSYPVFHNFIYFIYISNNFLVRRLKCTNSKIIKLKTWSFLRNYCFIHCIYIKQKFVSRTLWVRNSILQPITQW